MLERIRWIAATCLTACMLAAGSAGAQPRELSVKIGVLTDMSGILSDASGRGSVEATLLAVEDFRRIHPEVRVEVISGDHQIKPDIGSSIARRWLDREGVDAIVDAVTSPLGLAINTVTAERNKVFLASGLGHNDITGSKCTKSTVMFTYSVWALANGTGNIVVRQGGDTWFFITADYAYGHAVQADVSEIVRASGGKVVGAAIHPLATSDFASFLLQAQSSEAKIIGLANAGSDLVNTVKQASEFGLVPGPQKLAALVMFITDVHAIGLRTAQGLLMTTAFYWDLTPSTREFAQRFAARMGGRMPTQVQAGAYSSTLRYLEAVRTVGSTADGAAVVAAMREPGWFEDPLFGRTRILPNGTVQHAMYVAEVKAPSESAGPWDYYKILATIPPEQAFLPMERSGCPLIAGTGQ